MDCMPAGLKNKRRAVAWLFCLLLVMCPALCSASEITVGGQRISFQAPPGYQDYTDNPLIQLTFSLLASSEMGIGGVFVNSANSRYGMLNPNFFADVVLLAYEKNASRVSRSSFERIRRNASNMSSAEAREFTREFNLLIQGLLGVNVTAGSVEVVHDSRNQLSFLMPLEIRDGTTRSSGFYLISLIRCGNRVLFLIHIKDNERNRSNFVSQNVELPGRMNFKAPWSGPFSGFGSSTSWAFLIIALVLGVGVYLLYRSRQRQAVNDATYRYSSLGRSYGEVNRKKEEKNCRNCNHVYSSLLAQCPECGSNAFYILPEDWRENRQAASQTISPTPSSPDPIELTDNMLAQLVEVLNNLPRSGSAALETSMGAADAAILASELNDTPFMLRDADLDGYASRALQPTATENNLRGQNALLALSIQARHSEPARATLEYYAMLSFNRLSDKGAYANYLRSFNEMAQQLDIPEDSVKSYQKNLESRVNSKIEAGEPNISNADLP